jgi:hypothetical protein
MPSAGLPHREEDQDEERTEPVPLIVSPWLDEPREHTIEGPLAESIAAAVRSQRCFAFTDHAHPGRHLDWDSVQWERFVRWAAVAAPHFTLDNWVLKVEVVAGGGTDSDQRCRVRATLATRRPAEG